MARASAESGTSARPLVVLSRHPLERIRSSQRHWLVVPFLLATVILWWLLTQVLEPGGWTVEQLSLARSRPAAQRILDAWSQTDDDRARAAFVVGLDYLFIPVYTTTAMLLCLWGACCPKAARAGRQRLLGLGSVAVAAPAGWTAPAAVAASPPGAWLRWSPG